MINIAIFAALTMFGIGAGLFYFWDNVKNWTSGISGTAAGFLGGANEYIQAAIKPIYDIISGVSITTGAWVYIIGLSTVAVVAFYNTVKYATPWK